MFIIFIEMYCPLNIKDNAVNNVVINAASIPTAENRKNFLI